MLSDAGRRGLSVIATEEFGHRGFRLQARACDAADTPVLVKQLSSCGTAHSVALIWRNSSIIGPRSLGRWLKSTDSLHYPSVIAPWRHRQSQ